MFDLSGIDIRGAQELVQLVRQVLDRSRHAGVRVVYLHAFFLDYWPVLVQEATMQAGPPLLQEATVKNVEEYFGWTLTASEYIRTINQHLVGEARV